jgi:hypothetical protein
MLLAKPISTPMSASTTLSRFEGSTITDSTLYRSTMRSFQYPSITRPDIAFAINKVSQFMQDPKDPHWPVVKRILRYSKSKISHTFYIYKNSSKQLTAYSYSDWASCPHSIIVFFLEKTIYHGASRNNQLLNAPALNLSTKPLPMQPLN